MSKIPEFRFKTSGQFRILYDMKYDCKHYCQYSISILMKMFIWGTLISVEYFHDEYFLTQKKGTMAIYYLLCGNFSELGSTGFNSIWNLQDLSQKCSHFFNMIKVKIKWQVVYLMFDEFVTLHFICRGFAGF